MNPLDFLNNNPALMSIIAFPIGLLLLVGMGKLLGLNKYFNSYVDAMNKHTAAELKIEERLQDVVQELKNIAMANNDTRSYFDTKMTEFSRKLERMQQDLTVILTIAKKRKSDWMREPNTEVFRQERRTS